MANYKIENIEGIGPVKGEKFRAAGIKDTDSLLINVFTPKQRKEFAGKTGLAEAQILKFANMVDLYRIKGIGSEYSELLEAAGVDTVPEFAKRKAANSWQVMANLNKEKSSSDGHLQKLGIEMDRAGQSITPDAQVLVPYTDGPLDTFQVAMVGLSIWAYDGNNTRNSSGDRLERSLWIQDFCSFAHHQSGGYKRPNSAISRICVDWNPLCNTCLHHSDNCGNHRLLHSVV